MPQAFSHMPLILSALNLASHSAHHCRRPSGGRNTPIMTVLSRTQIPAQVPSPTSSARRRLPGPAAAVRAMSDLPVAMPARPHILVVNGRKVRQPVFVIGAPHSARTCSPAP